MNEAIRVLVVDDHPLFRQGVAHSLDGAADITVVGEASNGEDALLLARELLPDIVLLDISMPGWGGISTAEKINAACPATKIIMLTVSDERDNLLAALKAGARSYILKGVSAAKLVNAVRTMASSDCYLSPALAGEMLALLTSKPAADPLQELNARERSILALIGNGLTNREIGEQIHLSEKTIKHYVSNILQKLQVRSRVEAALFASRKLQHPRP